MVAIIIFVFIDTATTDIYTLSLHDALPISGRAVDNHTWPVPGRAPGPRPPRQLFDRQRGSFLRFPSGDRKSTRLNSSHPSISYAVFCLKKKNVHRSTITN